MTKPWLGHYPVGMPADLPVFPYQSLAELLEEAFQKHAGLPAFRFMGMSLSFRELDAQSRIFAAYLQSLGLGKGDRVALMMPNVPQYPVAVAGVLRAGMVVVNTNPLYTPRELEHQLSDSGCRAIVILENMAGTLEACRQATGVEHVVVARSKRRSQAPSLKPNPSFLFLLFADLVVLAEWLHPFPFRTRP